VLGETNKASNSSKGNLGSLLLYGLAGFGGYKLYKGAMKKKCNKPLCHSKCGTFEGDIGLYYECRKNLKWWEKISYFIKDSNSKP